MSLIHTSTEDVHRIIYKIEQAVDDEDDDDIMVACLSMALFYQFPHISISQLVEGVRGVSEWMVAFADSLDTPKSKENMN
jgi:hypothetical protein